MDTVPCAIPKSAAELVSTRLFDERAEDLLPEAVDDVLTSYTGDIDLTDLLECEINALPDADVNEDFADIDWKQVDWDDVARDWTLDELHTCNSDDSDDRALQNKRRRLTEVERLRKYSWERHEMPVERGKRMRYKYVHRDGSTATSLREALRRCNEDSAPIL